MNEKQVQILLGKRIREIRKLQGLTQESASEKAGTISVKRWSDIERGRYSIGLNNIFRIAKGLNVPIVELFSFEKISKKSNIEKVIGKKLSDFEKQAGRLEKEASNLRREIQTLKNRFG